MNDSPNFDPETGEIHATPEARPLATLAPVPRQQQLVPLASASCAQVCSALAAAQGEFEPIRRTKTGEVRGTTAAGRDYKYDYKYAPLDEIISAIQPALTKYQLGRQQYLVTRDGNWILRTIVWHSSGEWIACDYPVFAERKGGQGFAAGVTYARRQGYCLALGLAPEDDDDNQSEPRTDMTRPAPPPPPDLPSPPPAPPTHSASLSNWSRNFVESFEAVKPDSWKRFVFDALDQAPTRADIGVIAAQTSVTDALNRAPFKAELRAKLAGALDRFSPQRPGEAWATDEELAGPEDGGTE